MFSNCSLAQDACQTSARTRFLGEIWVLRGLTWPVWLILISNTRLDSIGISSAKDISIQVGRFDFRSHMMTVAFRLLAPGCTSLCPSSFSCIWTFSATMLDPRIDLAVRRMLKLRVPKDLYQHYEEIFLGGNLVIE